MTTCSDTGPLLRDQPPRAGHLPQTLEREVTVEPHQEQADLDRERVVEERVEHCRERRAHRHARGGAHFVEGRLQFQRFRVVEILDRGHIPRNGRELHRQRIEEAALLDREPAGRLGLVILGDLQEPVTLVLAAFEVAVDALAVLEGDGRNDAAVVAARMAGRIGKRDLAALDAEHGDVGGHAGLERAGDVRHRERARRIDGDALDHLLQREPKLEEAGRDIGERIGRARDIELLQVGADDVGHKVLRVGLLRHAPGEIVAAEAHVEEHAAVLRLPHHRQHLAVAIEDAALVAVVDVGDDIARFGDLVDLVGGVVARLELVLPDMGVERQAEDFREPLGEPGRPAAIAAEGADLQVAHKAGMRLHEIEPVGDRHIRDRAHIAFDEVEAQDAERPQIRPGVKAGDRAPAQQREELVERADAGTARLHIRRHALIDANAVGIGEAERAVDVDVDVDPARGQVAAGEIDYLRIRRQILQGADLAVLDRNVDNPIDALVGVDHMGAFQQDCTARRLHRQFPSCLLYTSRCV